MTPGAPTDELLFRYVAGLASASERGAVDAWVRADPSNEQRLDDVRRIWAASRGAPSRDVDRMWTRLHASIDPGRTSGAVGPGSAHAVPRIARPEGSTRSRAAWAAAGIVLVAGAAALLKLPAPRVHASAAAPSHVYATGRAQTANVRLRDGTRVVLAPESRLTVPDAFGDSDRTVSLDGQAVFDVVHDPAHPFRARAKGAVAEDIGTRFELRAYGDEQGVSVIVTAGAVTFGHASGAASNGAAEGVVVRRGERARTDGPDGTTVLDHVPAELTDWTTGRLSFAKTPLADVARTLGRWYDLDVRVPDAAMRARPVTADFDTQSPREMVAALATAVGGRVEQEGRTLTIRPNR